jgi:uncharacterized membrane protein YfcA
MLKRLRKPILSDSKIRYIDVILLIIGIWVGIWIGSRGREYLQYLKLSRLIMLTIPIVLAVSYTIAFLQAFFHKYSQDINEDERRR